MYWVAWLSPCPGGVGGDVFILGGVRAVLVVAVGGAPLLFLLFYFLYAAPMLCTTSAVFIGRTHVPILVRERSGILFCLHLGTRRDGGLGGIILGFSGKAELSSVRSIGLCCDNARTLRGRRGGHFTPIRCVSDRTIKGALTTGPSCSVGGTRIDGPGTRMALGNDRSLFPNIGCF